MAAGRKEQTVPFEVRAASEPDFPFKSADTFAAQLNAVLPELSGRLLPTSVPSLQATTSAIQCFIMTARSAPLSPLP